MGERCWSSTNYRPFLVSIFRLVSLERRDSKPLGCVVGHTAELTKTVQEIGRIDKPRSAWGFRVVLIECFKSYLTL